jgi:glutamyl-tRNA synthetase
MYREEAQRLMAQGHAYFCYCSEEELEARRKEALARQELPKYDRRCLHRSGPPPAGITPVIRFMAPQTGQTIVHDAVKGQVIFDNNQLDDLIILRSNGMPTYNFGAVVDDAIMGITHVIRGDDHLNNTPRQILLYQALGYALPQFGHLSMILGMDKVKLSKRHGATSVLEYQEAGFLPEALLNYLARLGWSHGDQEIFSVPELVEKFSLDHITKSPAAFNPDKLLWLNRHYMRQGDPERLTDLLIPVLRSQNLVGDQRSPDRDWLVRLVNELKGRSRTLLEMAEAARPFLSDSISVDEALARQYLVAAVKPAMMSLVSAIERDEFDHEHLERALKGILTEFSLRMNDLAQPLRVALTARTASPGIYEVMLLLGRERTISRLRQAVDLIR